MFMYLRVKAELPDNAFLFTGIKPVLIVLVAVTQQFKFRFRPVQSGGGFEKLFDSLFPHHAPHIEETHRLPFGVFLKGVTEQINA